MATRSSELRVRIDPEAGCSRHPVVAVLDVATGRRLRKFPYSHNPQFGRDRAEAVHMAEMWVMRARATLVAWPAKEA